MTELTGHVHFIDERKLEAKKDEGTYPDQQVGFESTIMGFRYHTPKLYIDWPEIELPYSGKPRMLKSVFFSLSLPGNLRSPKGLLDLPNFLSATLISEPYLSSP